MTNADIYLAGQLGDELHPEPAETELIKAKDAEIADLKARIEVMQEIINNLQEEWR